MNKIYFTSDLHFCHDKDFLYKPRGFDNIEDMNNTIVRNWNSVVDSGDDVFILGDLMLNDNEKGMRLLESLNGHLHIILGNHDTNTRIQNYLNIIQVHDIQYAYLFKHQKANFYLSHYPTITANFDDEMPWHKNIINLFGHTHQQDNFYNNNPYMYHVGMDSHNCFPVSIDQIIEDVKQKKEELTNNKNFDNI